MKRLLLSIIYFLLFFGLVNAQNPKALSFYELTESIGTFTSISATGDYLGTGDDTEFDLDLTNQFSFTYNEAVYETFTVGANGAIMLGALGAEISYTNDLDGANYPIISPFWDDMNLVGDGAAYYQLEGTSGEQILTIEWYNIASYGETDFPVSYQIKMEEATGIFSFVYGDMSEAVNWTCSGSIGFNDFDGFGSITPGTPATMSNEVENDNIINTEVGAIATGTTYTFTYEVSSCPPPSVLTSYSLSNSAYLGWIENGSSTTWDIEWGVSGFTATGIPTNDDVTENPFLVTGLITSTDYDFYVRSDCGIEQSEWVGPYTFTTTCEIFDVPWIESFEDNFIFTCWTNEATSQFIWEINDGNLHGPGFVSDGTFALMFDVYTAQTGNTATATLPVFNLEGITNPVFSFDYWMNGPADPNLWLKVEMAPNVYDWTEIFYQEQDGSISEWTSAQVDLADVTSNTKFRIIAGSDYGSYNTFVDKIRIGANPLSDASLIDLTVDSVTVANFESSILIYDVELPEGTTIVPTVVGTPTNPNATAETTAATSLPGTSTVLVTSEDGTTTETYAINFTVLTGVNDIVVEEVSVYPNPSNGIFTAQIPGSHKSATITISDFSGKTVKQFSVNHNKISVDLSNYPKGVYFMMITTETSSYITKLVSK